MSPEVEIDVHRLAREQLAEATRRLDDLHVEVSGLEQRIKRLTKIQEATRAGVCRNCGGYGLVNVWYDQDDCKTETCDVCTGSGAKAEAGR